MKSPYGLLYALCWASINAPNNLLALSLIKSIRMEYVVGRCARICTDSSSAAFVFEDPVGNCCRHVFKVEIMFEREFRFAVQLTGYVTRQIQARPVAVFEMLVNRFVKQQWVDHHSVPSR